MTGDTFEVAIGVPGSCRNYKEVSSRMLREDGDWKWVNVMSCYYLLGKEGKRGCEDGEKR